MKAYYQSVLALVALLLGTAFVSCNDANEYEDAMASNPSWVENYTDSLQIAHPESIANTKWERGSGLKTNVYGDEVQGFVESLDFYRADSVIVKMSTPTIPASMDKSVITWVDDSNTDTTPSYEYTYSNVTGKIDILKMTKDEKGKVSKSSVFTAIVTSGTKEVLTICHYGDTPVQTYLVRK